MPRSFLAVAIMDVRSYLCVHTLHTRTDQHSAWLYSSRQTTFVLWLCLSQAQHVSKTLFVDHWPSVPSMPHLSLRIVAAKDRRSQRPLSQRPLKPKTVEAKDNTRRAYPCRKAQDACRTGTKT